MATSNAASGPARAAVDPEGHDGVCFTAGPRAAVVGAGTIHAYLATRRKAPRVVAGISLGSVSAAAMQRVYRRLAHAQARVAEQVIALGIAKAVAARAAADSNAAAAKVESEARALVRLQGEARAERWAWFRQYIESLCTEPLNVIWRAIPDQSDFFADVIPIVDSAVPPALTEDEREARRLLYLKVKLGRWLAQFPTTVRLLASTVVNYVRARERYPRAQRMLSSIKLLGNVTWLVFLVTRHVCLRPQMFPEHAFAGGKTRGLPGVVWLNLFSVSIVLAVPIGVLAAIAVISPPDSAYELWRDHWRPALVTTLIAAVLAVTRRYRQRLLETRLMKAIVLRPLEAGAYAYSAVNALSLLFFVGTLAPPAWRWLHTQAPWKVPDGVSVVFVLWIVATLLFALVAVPFRELRVRLIERGLFHNVPRPLFGWWVFVSCWSNLAGLLATVGFGAALTWMGRPTNAPLQPIAALLQLAILALLPVVTLAPLGILVLIWKGFAQLASARRGVLSVVAFVLSWIIAIGSFYPITLIFDRWKNLFHEGLAGHGTAGHELLWHLFVASAFLVMVTWFALVVVATQPVWRRRVAEQLLEKVGLKRGLISDVYLTLALMRLFDPAAGFAARKEGERLGTEFVEEGTGYPAAVLVAASLQTLYEKGRPRPIAQLWARPKTPLLHALRCAVSAPPLFAPVRVKKRNELAWWLKKSALEDPENRKQLAMGLDLVDGSVIRQNPLPAMYSFLRGEPLAEEMEANNDANHPAIHVVYGVPIGERAAGEAIGTRSTGKAAGGTIVDVGLTSLRLSQRRDTQLEVRQTNFIASLEHVTPGQAADKKKATHAIFADEIAPEHDLVFGDSDHDGSELKPARRKVLEGMASGCRRSIETLYRHELRMAGRLIGGDGCVSCPDFLTSIGRVTKADGDVPGLPEVCECCSQRLRPEPATTGDAVSTLSLGRYLGKETQMYELHPQLGGQRARIVFVASGGVFRGAFHIGMLAAMRLGRITPDLIVGASVGTLMGGALGAMLCATKPDVLEQLVGLFLHVDERVALTRTLKNAARELGLRGRSIKLSPQQMRRIVRRGSRRDPGYAATGAPSALVDAISDLFLIPHQDTAKIAAEFVAGHVSKATWKFLLQLRTETIRRLDIEEAVIGTSLLERVAADLLTDGRPESRRARQPFQGGQIAFYGTATDLSRHSPIVLGGAALHPDTPYDFVEAALASSAFPAVFAPRPESLVFPGTGRRDVLLADGGMFDNLPFQPALEILSLAQRGYRGTDGAALTARQWLRQRIARPDLLIAGALDPRPEADEHATGTYDSLEDVRRRAVSLNHNVKIRSFEMAAQRVYGQLMRLESGGGASLDTPSSHFADGVVNGGVLSVFPASRDHLNGTFSFCASTGLQKHRVSKSIADGCYQTLRSVADRKDEASAAGEAALAMKPELLTARAVHQMTSGGWIDTISVRRDARVHGRQCPFFDKNKARFDCPFATSAHHDRSVRTSMHRVFMQCIMDRQHQP